MIQLDKKNEKLKVNDSIVHYSDCFVIVIIIKWRLKYNFNKYSLTHHQIDPTTVASNHNIKQTLNYTHTLPRTHTYKSR